MPFTVADVEKHNKGLSAKYKRMWVAVANSAMDKCEKEGGDKCDVSAIMQANGTVAKALKGPKEAAVEFLASEAGKKISAESAKAIQAAIAALNTLLDGMESESARPELIDTFEDQLHEAVAMSYDEQESAIRNALQGSYSDPGSYVWLVATYPGYVVYNVEITSDTGYSCITYQADYTVGSDGSVSLGDPMRVKRVIRYEPVDATEAAPVAEEEVAASAEESESVQDDGEEFDEVTGVLLSSSANPPGLIPLREAKANADGVLERQIKLIRPGWGSSGYYPAQTLRRDGATVFPSGTHMYWNHQTEAEEEARPEGDLRDLAAVLTEDAHYEELGQDGPGLYARAKLLGPYKEVIPEVAPHIGVSIRAWGKAVDGEAEGQKGKIVEQLTQGRSVDFVTMAGAGGKVLELLEAARNRHSDTRTGGTKVDEQEERRLRETLQAATDQNTALTEALGRMQEREIARDVRDIVRECIASEDSFQEMTRQRLAASLPKMADKHIKEGELDAEGFREAVMEEIEAEKAYLQTVTAGMGFRISGMGQTQSESDAQKVEQSTDRLTKAFESMGMSSEGAKLAGVGRGA